MYEIEVFDYSNSIRKLETQKFQLFSEVLLYLENCKYYDDIKFIVDRNIEKVDKYFGEIKKMRQKNEKIIIIVI